MAAQHIDTEWRELLEREQILFRLHTAVAEADRRVLRARLARASRPVSARTFLASRGH